MGVTKLNKAFKPLYTSKKRYFLLTGGRGSLKTSTVHDFVLRLTYQKGHGILFTRYTMTSAEKSIIPEFKLIANRINADPNFIITKNKAVNKLTGSFIYFSGIKTSSGDQTANLKSISGITTWVIEEGEDFRDEKTFETIDDSIRSILHQNRVIWIQNPTTKEHFIYKKWIQPNSKKEVHHGYDVTVSNLDTIEHIHTTYHKAVELNYLAQSWVDKADLAQKEVEYKLLSASSDSETYEIKHTSHYYYNYIGGWLEKAEGVIFTNWTEGVFNNDLPVKYGLDFGYTNDPTALVKVAIDEKRKVIYAKEELYKTRLSTNDIIDSLSSRLNRRDLIKGDSAEPRLIAEIKSSGFNIKPCVKGADSVRAGIKHLKNYQLIIDPNSQNLKTELNNYVWNDKRSGSPVDDYNHLIDALRYAVFEGKKNKMTLVNRRHYPNTQQKRL